MLTRRGMLAGAAASVAAAGVARVATVDAQAPAGVSAPHPDAAQVAFRGEHQAGIASPQQQHGLVASYDVTSADVAAVAAALDAWTVAADALTSGRPTGHDSGEAIGLGPARLTVTVGFGRLLFSRLGLRVPPALVDLPAFAGERLEPRWCGGDVVVQACADDPQVAHHAVRTLTRIGSATLRPRWLQQGFLPRDAGATPRNLFGFTDGTANLRGSDAAGLAAYVWVERDHPGWMRGGSYLVVRRIRMRLERWDASSLSEQEHAIGRTKATDVRLPRAVHGHATLAQPMHNGGVRLLRRGYGYADGLDPHTGELDAGLLFLAYQRDPSSQFARIQRSLAAHDAMNEYVTHVGSAVFAIPAGLSRIGTWGAALRAAV